MAIPNMLAEVERLSIKFPQAWKDAHTGNAHTEDFIYLLAAHLHAIDPRFGLNGKRGDPNDISDDVINFKGEGADFDPTDGNAPRTVIDVIAGAGGPNPRPQWAIVSSASHPVGAAWVRPGSAPQPDPEPPHVCPELKIPGYEELGGDSFYRAMIGVPLAADHAVAGQHLNDGSAVWFSRAVYRLMAAFIKANGQPIDPTSEIKIVRNEWRQILGLPPLR